MVGFLRRRGVGDPILVLRLSRGSRGACEVLDRGADSCVSSDCGPDELASWLRALCRRGPSRWDLGAPELELTDAARALRIRGTSFHFGPVAFRVIRYLVENRDHWVSQREIIEKALRTHHAAESSVVRVQIHQIRKIMGSYRDCVRLSSQRGCGYTFTLSHLPAVANAEAAPARPPPFLGS
jgi:DNA-binding response OmpR family regulator